MPPDTVKFLEKFSKWHEDGDALLSEAKQIKLASYDEGLPEHSKYLYVFSDIEWVLWGAINSTHRIDYPGVISEMKGE